MFANDVKLRATHAVTRCNICSDGRATVDETRPGTHTAAHRADNSLQVQPPINALDVATTQTNVEAKYKPTPT
jgi:hypothetical protein